MNERSVERQRERDAAVANLRLLLDELPMVETQRNFILHAIKVIKENK